jgi:hypothetical protein
MLSLLVLVGACALVGCKRSAVKLNPVNGQVFFKDQPAEGAQVVFQPAGETTAQQPMAYGTVGADGAFALRTGSDGEGAAAGEYNVMITWYGKDPGDPEKSVAKLPAKYADQSNPLIKATVKEGTNTLEPYRLK